MEITEGNESNQAFTRDCRVPTLIVILINGELPLLLSSLELLIPRCYATQTTQMLCSKF